jgi:hypothetical protein
MKVWDWVLVALCGLWVLALLWVAAPDNDIVRALVSGTMASWLQAIGAIASVFAVLGLARWELARAERRAVATKREVLYAVKLMAKRGELAVLLLSQEVAVRASSGQSIDAALARYGDEADRLAASTHRLTLGRGLGVEETLLIDDYLIAIGRRFAPIANAFVVELDASGVRDRLRDIERRADDLLQRLHPASRF